ncbi:MAG TPA: Mur ligase family protein [Gemmatimonadota bacterium]|nr:Mur ligase family protein [Gemmatimonadota bacterium]
MSEYRTALSALHALEAFGMRLGLENVADYCAAAGHPERAWQALHVAGTNGKGTTAACLAALARRHGLRAGLYTSPHLVDFRERIRVDGEPISRPGFVGMWDRVGPFVQERSMTFFEAGTLMAMEWFAERRVDVAVLEVGLGGRLDATNVVIPALSIVTNIALDHERHLGSDLAAIAREKAGIFKPGVPALVGEADAPSVREALAAAARERGTPIGWLGQEARWETRSQEAGWTTFDYESERGRLEGLALPLAGDQFVVDAALALRAWERWRGELDPAAVKAALAEAVPPGRMESRSVGAVPYLFDVAHNPAAVDRLAAVLPRSGVVRWTFVAGILADKRWEEMLDALLRFAPCGHLCGLATANPGRRLSAREAAAALASRPGIAWSESVGEGLAAARKDVEAGLADAVLVTGSFHTVGEALLALGLASDGEPYERMAAAPPVLTRGGAA